MDVASMGAYLMEQTRVNRLFLFLQGTDRFLYMFAKNYEKSKKRIDIFNFFSIREL